MSKNLKGVFTQNKLTVIESDIQVREAYEMALITKIFAALDKSWSTNDFTEADELIDQLRPKGDLKSVHSPTKTE